jgi:hypothetical protein
MVGAYWVSQSIHVAARLNIADQLADGPRGVSDLAKALGVDPEVLYRLLRALSSVGVFAERESHSFELTPLAECLRTDSPESIRAWVIAMTGLPWEPWGHLLECVRDGQCAFEKVYGMSRYEYLSRHPEQGAWFDRAMAAYKHRVQLSALYDFSRSSTVIDLGGGLGDCLADILNTYPHLSAVLLEQAEVLEAARENLRGQGLENRCRCLAGDFFEHVPPEGDVYILKSILHNWNDEQALHILHNCRAAMSGSSRLLVVEPRIRDDDNREMSAFMDLHMLVMHGGRERTEEDMAALLSRANLKVRSVTSDSRVLVMEAEPFYP